MWEIMNLKFFLETSSHDQSLNETTLVISPTNIQSVEWCFEVKMDSERYMINQIHGRNSKESYRFLDWFLLLESVGELIGKHFSWSVS